MHHDEYEHCPSQETISDSLSSYSKISDMDQHSRTKPSEEEDYEFSQELRDKTISSASKQTVSHPKGRKSKEILKILIQYYHMYEGHWDEQHFRDLIQKTGYSKKQLNKWFWDRKERQREELEAKKLTYPGLIF